MIALNFIMITDDYIFANLKFNEIFDFVFNNNSTGIGAIRNGRYLGNLLGILLSTTYNFGKLKYLRGIFMGSGIFLLILLCSKLSGIDKDKLFIICALLLLIAPVGIYAHVYSWTAAYMNYLLPTIFIVAILLILDKCINKEKYTTNIDVCLIMLLGILCQLCSENITIYMVLFSSFIFFISIFRYKKYKKISIPFFISTVVGAIIMFSCKGYREINSDGYRSLSINNLSGLLNSVFFNIWCMVKFIFSDNYLIISMILISCFIIILKSNKKNKYMKLFTILCIYLIIYVIGIKFINIETLSRNLRLTKYVLDFLGVVVFLSILIYTVNIYVQDNDCKNSIYFYCISIIFVSAPMLIVSPIGERCFFICYVFLVIICAKLFAYIFKNNMLNIPRLNTVITLLVLSILINKYYIYNDINKEFNQIVEYTKEQMIESKESILLPNFKFANHINADLSYSIGLYYYYDYPNDISFKTIERDLWDEISK